MSKAYKHSSKSLAELKADLSQYVERKYPYIFIDVEDVSHKFGTDIYTYRQIAVYNLDEMKLVYKFNSSVYGKAIRDIFKYIDWVIISKPNIKLNDSLIVGVNDICVLFKYLKDNYSGIAKKIVMRTHKKSEWNLEYKVVYLTIDKNHQYQFSAIPNSPHSYGSKVRVIYYNGYVVEFSYYSIKNHDVSKYLLDVKTLRELKLKNLIQ
jgi:hypothetical protein